jgi:hypothetical protein
MTKHFSPPVTEIHQIYKRLESVSNPNQRHDKNNIHTNDLNNFDQIDTLRYYEAAQLALAQPKNKKT